jgi:hypothetical protein
MAVVLVMLVPLGLAVKLGLVDLLAAIVSMLGHKYIKGLLVAAAITMKDILSALLGRLGLVGLAVKLAVRLGTHFYKV